jgi:NAD+ kinase
MFNKILIVYSEKQATRHLETIEQVKKILNSLNKRYSYFNVTTLQPSYFQDVDLVITIGGDGTFIRAAHFLKDIPILGINSEPRFSEGALTSLNEDELARLPRILQGEHSVILRQRAEVRKNNILLDELAVNEVHVGSSAHHNTSRYIISIDNQEEEHRSSGVLITTGSGSTAWYKSAGGDPFSYKARLLKFLVREPYFSRLFQPSLLKGDVPENQKIIFKAKRYQEGVIAIDSNKVYDFNIPDIVEIQLSDKPLKVITK